MSLKRTLLSLSLLAVIAAPAAQAEITLDVIGGSEISFEGLLQADGNWFRNDIADLNNTGSAQFGINGHNKEFDLRRAELVFKGKGPGQINWVVGYDAKSKKWLDVNARYTIGANANNYVQLGQYKQPHSLEELSSTKSNDFIAKASITNAFGISRRVGLAVGTGDTNWTATASVFTRELTRNTTHGPGWGARATFAPINADGQTLHFGLSYVDRDTTGDAIRLRARPLADLAPIYLVDTGNITDVDRAATAGVEAMYINGPLKFQGEYMRTAVKGNTSAKDFDADGGYVSALWNVTGERFGYKAGVSTTGLPDNPARGMIQLGLRYDMINLNDGSIQPGSTPRAVGVMGGEQQGWTAGVNWYWRSNFKISLNYNKITSEKFIAKTGATYSTLPEFRNATLNRVVEDNPSTVTARFQLFW